MMKKIQQFEAMARERQFNYRYRDGESCYHYPLNIEKFADLIIDELCGYALEFNQGMLALNDKEIRSHSQRIASYMKERIAK